MKPAKRGSYGAAAIRAWATAKPKPAKRTVTDDDLIRRIFDVIWDELRDLPRDERRERLAKLRTMADKRVPLPSRGTR